MGKKTQQTTSDYSVFLQYNVATSQISMNTKQRKKMFYLMTHSTRFILQLYAVRHMVKLDNE